MKKTIVLVTVLLILGLVLGGFIAYRHWSIEAYAGPDQSLRATEEALATQDMVFLISLDVEYLRALDAKLYGTPHIPDLITSEEREPKSVFDQISRSLLKQYDAVQYVTLAAYLTKDNGPAIALVSGGHLRQEEALAFLKNYPDAKPAPGLPNAWIVQVQDPDTCALSREWTIVIDNDRVITTTVRDAGIIDRVRNNAPAARDLGRWLEFRKDRFAAAGLFMPDSLQNSGMDPMTQTLASTARNELADFDALYLGASTLTFPVKGQLSLWLSGKSAVIAEQKAGAWKTSLADSRKNWQTNLPALAALHDRAHIEARGNLVAADITFDRELPGQLRELANEFISLLFSGFGKQTNLPKPGEPVREMIDNKPVRFTEAVGPDDIKPYDPKATFAGKADTSSGPFGISISAIRQTKTEPKTTELEIAAKGMGLPNLIPGKADRVELIVNSVKDQAGSDLLRTERCGPDRNDRPAKGNVMYGFPVVEAQKTVRLKETASLKDIARIEGLLHFRMPSRVETVTLKGPKPGDHFDRDKTRVEVLSVGKNEITYRVSGDTTSLLMVRGINSQGKVLSFGGGSSTQVPGGPLSASRAFLGEASDIEFIIARAVEEKTFPFTLQNALPQIEPDSRSQPVAFARYPGSEFKRDLAKPFSVQHFMKPASSTNAGPVVVDLNQIGSFLNMGLNFTVYLPLVRNLEGTLSAIDVEVDSLSLTNGTVVRPEKGSFWRASVPMNRSGNDSYFHGTARIETTIKGETPAHVQAVSGHVSMRIAEVPKSVPINGTAFAQVQNTPCGPVTITELGRSKMVLEGAGDPECVYAFLPSLGGQQLFIRHQSLRKTETGWSADLQTSGLPDKVEIVTAPKVHKVRYPFKLKTES